LSQVALLEAPFFAIENLQTGNMEIERNVLITYNFVRNIVLKKLQVALVWLTLELHRWGKISNCM